VHLGGPLFAKKDLGWWQIPKGELLPGEDPLVAAIREVEEEIGLRVEGEFVRLPTVKQKGGKRVQAWAVEADFDCSGLRSMQIELEWPPRSGKTRWFPEVDRAEWFTLAMARRKILEAQQPFLDALGDAFPS
jgi:predicted NUDIX family NTP pyrophosphohydrolase